MRATPAYPGDGSLQTQERVLLNDRRDLAAEAARDRRLVAHERAARLLDRFDNRFDIPRADSTQINDLARNVKLLLRFFRGFEADVHLHIPRIRREK